MRSRPWILVFALITTLLALIAYQGWTIFKANERIKNYLISKIKPVFGEKCDISYLDMAVGAVHLKGVYIESHNSIYSLWIEDLRIGYNLVNLIKHGFKPQKSPQDILFVNPRLTIKYRPPIQQPDTSRQSPEDNYHAYFDKVRAFDFLKRITISKGVLIYEDSLNQKTILANDISGWISTRDLENARARLVGKLFHSNKLNLRLDGQINLLQEKLDFLKVNLINFKWKEKVPFFIPNYLDIQQGKVNGDLLIAQNSEQGGFDIEGKLTIEDGAVKIQHANLFIEKINLDAAIKDWDFIIKNSQQLFNGSPVTIEGKIKNILAPVFDVKIFSRSFDIQKFQAYLNPQPKIKFSGNSNLLCTVSSSYQQPLIKAVIDCPQLSVGKDRLDRMKLNMSFTESALSIDKVSGSYHLMNIEGNGKVDFSPETPQIKLHLVSQGKLPDDFTIEKIKSLASGHCLLNLNVWGDLKRIFGEAKISVIPKFNEAIALKYSSNFAYADEKFTLEMFDRQKNKHIDGLFTLSGKGINYAVKFTNIHRLLYQLPEFSSLKKLFDFEHSIFDVRAQSSRTKVTGRFDWKGGKEEEGRSGMIDIQLKDDGEAKRIYGEFDAKFGNQRYHGTANLVHELDVITIKKIQLDNIFSGDGTINLSGSKGIDARLTFVRSDVNHIYHIFALNSSLIRQGELDGTITVSGLLADPQLKGQLSLSDCYLNDVGVYEGALSFYQSNKLISIDKFVLNRNGVAIINGQGKYDIGADDFDFNIKSHHVDLDLFIQSLTANTGLIKGMADVDLTMVGSIRNPELRGEVSVGRGQFSKFQFDSMYAVLGDQATARSGGIKISQISLKRNNQFQIQGQGIIPIAAADTLDLNLVGNGNLLAILPEITPFFKRTASIGSWQIHFTGSLENLRIKGGSINLDKGFLKLGAVAPEIKEIAANITIEADGFVRVDNISGKIRGRPFQFRNARAEDICTHEPLAPFYIDDLGLDFGVFFLETTNKGVPLHIPALMAKGEIGNFEFFGRDSCEKFYFAGPVSQPTVRGNIRLRNVNVMFPFDEVPGMGGNPVVHLLRIIRWNVKAIPGKDTRYEKEIPSGVDRVYVNLLTDNGVGGLDFGGIIDDESFYIEGALESTAGNVDYLDFDFRIEKAGVEFDKSSLFPIVYGNAIATIPDSLGVPNNIYLTLLLEDKTSGYIQSKGRWGKIYFKISADNPNLGMTEGEILASLGYSSDNIKEKATDIIGISTDNFLFRPLFRPFERQLERALNLDLVRVSSRFTRNLLEMNLWREDFEIYNSKLYLLRSTRLMLGKHLADKLFLSYTGQLESSMNYRSHEQELGLRHSLGLEYRINSNLMLEMEYNYNSFLLVPEDKRIFLRHSFPIY